MVGTILNVITVVAGSTIGILLGNRFPERIKQTVISGLGLFTFAIGIQMFLKTNNVLIVLGSIITGALLGEWWQIENLLKNLGAWLEAKFKVKENTNRSQERFIRGFLTASLVFCVGPMTILGAVQDGLTGDYQLLAVKAVLDGFASLAFASSLGIGVLFSTFVILVYQGTISLCATQVQTFVSEPMMIEMTAAGGVILLGISIGSLLEIRPIRAGNFLPALVTAPLLVWLISLFR
jgi:uncharacterized protein